MFIPFLKPSCGRLGRSFCRTQSGTLQRERSFLLFGGSGPYRRRDRSRSLYCFCPVPSWFCPFWVIVSCRFDVSASMQVPPWRRSRRCPGSTGRFLRGFQRMRPRYWERRNTVRFGDKSPWHLEIHCQPAKRRLGRRAHFFSLTCLNSWFEMIPAEPEPLAEKETFWKIECYTLGGGMGDVSQTCQFWHFQDCQMVLLVSWSSRCCISSNFSKDRTGRVETRWITQACKSATSCRPDAVPSTVCLLSQISLSFNNWTACSTHPKALAIRQ